MTSAILAIKQRPIEVMFNLCRGILIFGSIAMLVATLHPDLRLQVREGLMSDYRAVVSTAKGDLLGTGAELVVAKVKTQDALLLEVYQTLEDGTQKLIERIQMADSKDGFFNFNGKATNLAIDDIDGDGRPEILVPTFDKNLVGHLNVYRYSEASQNFQRLLN